MLDFHAMKALGCPAIQWLPYVIYIHTAIRLLPCHLVTVFAKEETLTHFDKVNQPRSQLLVQDSGQQR